MRLAVLSDIHGNLLALRRVVDALEGQRIDAWVCSGDLVGYGPCPNECVELVADRGMVCVAGNHDLMALGLLPREGIGRLAKLTIDWTAEELTDTARGFLRGLPRRAEVGRAIAAHGSLDDPRTYVDRSEAAASELRAMSRDHPHASLLLLGHTHRSLVYGARTGTVLAGRSGAVALRPGERYLLNPGSVGQARERRPLARFMVVDLEQMRTWLQALPYDHRACRRALRARGLPPGACHVRPGARRRLRRAGRGLLRSLPGRRRSSPAY